MRHFQQGKNILVIGLGPTGGILASYLAQAGYPVFGFDIWKDHVIKIQQEGLHLTGLNSLTARLMQASAELNGLGAIGFEYVFIAVKTPFLADVVRQLSALKGDFTAVALQNGIDNEEYLARHFERSRVMRMAVNYAGNMTGPGGIRMTFFNRPNYVGCLCGDERCAHTLELSQILTRAGLETEGTTDIRPYTWKKTILSAALSPVTALTGQTMAQAMADPETVRLVRLILEECIAVAAKAGLSFGDSFLEFCLDYLAKGGDHKPSMLIDLENRRPTEIDYINGKIVEYGRALGVPVPVNATLTCLVKAKEITQRRVE